MHWSWGETPPTGDLLPADLDEADRELVYACATWPETAEALQSKIDALRAGRREYLPRSEQLPWWEEFGELVRRLHAVCRASENRGCSGQPRR